MKPLPYLLALDQGTSSSRSIVFDAQGQIVAKAQREFRQIYPRPGWVEHDPQEIWTSQLATAQEVLAQARIGAADLASIGITNQRETTLVWRRASGEPLYNAIVWQDRRAEPACAALRERGLEATIREKTGLIVDAYFSGTKLKWILDNVPGARVAARRGELAFGTVDTWLAWRLTGGAVHATDVSNASRTMLFNVQQPVGRRVAGDAEIPREMLPDVHPSSHVYGHVRADLLGAPVVHRRHRRRPAKHTLRASVFPRRAGQEHLRHRLLHADAYRPEFPDQRQRTHHYQCRANFRHPEFALEGSVFIGGAVVQWLRDGLQIVNSSDDVQKLALSVPDSGR